MKDDLDAADLTQSNITHSKTFKDYKFDCKVGQREKREKTGDIWFDERGKTIPRQWNRSGRKENQTYQDDNDLYFARLDWTHTLNNNNNTTQKLY